jgi:hypothetical protein
MPPSATPPFVGRPGACRFGAQFAHVHAGLPPCLVRKSQKLSVRQEGSHAVVCHADLNPLSLDHVTGRGR